MKLHTGEIIWTFPDTDVEAYAKMIRNEGFNVTITKNYILVGEERIIGSFDSVALGRLIKLKRLAKGVSRITMAEDIRVAQETVFNWEIGRTKPQRANLDAIKKYLNITEGELKECLIQKQSI